MSFPTRSGIHVFDKIDSRFRGNDKKIDMTFYEETKGIKSELLDNPIYSDEKEKERNALPDEERLKLEMEKSESEARIYNVAEIRQMIIDVLGIKENGIEKMRALISEIILCPEEEQLRAQIEPKYQEMYEGKNIDAIFDQKSGKLLLGPDFFKGKTLEDQQHILAHEFAHSLEPFLTRYKGVSDYLKMYLGVDSQYVVDLAKKAESKTDLKEKSDLLARVQAERATEITAVFLRSQNEVEFFDKLIAKMPVDEQNKIKALDNDSTEKKQLLFETSQIYQALIKIIREPLQTNDAESIKATVSGYNKAYDNLGEYFDYGGRMSGHYFNPNEESSFARPTAKSPSQSFWQEFIQHKNEIQQKGASAFLPKIL
ncbi:MAG: hypothetical protein CEN91_206 [Candidatus Berkelbacteria bacterium Licking1014_85]|uniref:Uncharacterized protein n=1 Tax=Candidatus Berkelbacteria bacterium Licking1014_85 TaxID=2017148 RepID=A0A554LL13_9BACT|nr:MAG: hypothetical protein CEN91_206 [Candidatus Berkelbacteria bacterium Licking1014_85]